jgi:hypothetical protein
MRAEPQDDFPLGESIPEAAASLESILCTEELQERPWRPPDYEKENRTLVALASAMVDPKSNILQTFADTILEVTQCDSAGLSLLTKDGGKRFYWPAIAEEGKAHAGGGTPRNFEPCGDALDRGRSQQSCADRIRERPGEWGESRNGDQAGRSRLSFQAVPAGRVAENDKRGDPALGGTIQVTLRPFRQDLDLRLNAKSAAQVLVYLLSGRMDWETWPSWNRPYLADHDGIRLSRLVRSD